MKNCFSHLLILATALIPVTAGAQVLLLDVTNTVGTTTFGANVAPYGTASGDKWNRGGGGTSWGSSLQYSNGTVDTNLSVFVDGLENRSGGGAEYVFGSTSAVTGTANTGTGALTLFGNPPVMDADYSNTASSVSFGGVGMRIGGLAAGTYDIYVISAYIGTATAARPADSPSSTTIARFNTYAFAAPLLGTLQSGTYGTYGGSANLLENNNNSTWVEGTNYGKFTVTLGGLNDSVYVITENALFGAEARGWLNAVQVVAVPEPSSLGMLAGALGLIAVCRRRRQA